MAKVKVDLSNLPDVTNNAFYPLYNNHDRYLVLMGGGSSGKSVFTAQKVIYRTLAEQGHRFLALRKVKNTLRDSVFAELKKVIDSWGMRELFTVPAGISSELYLRCANSNEILFAGLDDVEKLKSIVGITSMWIEEASELTPEDFRQLDIRMRGQTPHYKQIALTFNPISITHWLKTEFFDAPKADVTTLKTTYKDNRFLDVAAIRVLEGFKDTDPYYYMVYCLGEWGVIGQTVFDAQKVTVRLMQVRDAPLQCGELEGGYSEQGCPVTGTQVFTPCSGGRLMVYAAPQSRRPYVIGADTAEGGMDFSVAQVIDNITGEQVATWRGHCDTDLFAKELFKLGHWYNEALIAVETNFDLHPIKELERLGYGKQYLRETVDDITGRLQQKFGFRTTKSSRPPLIAGLVTVVRETPELINDLCTLEEMLTFVRDESGKPTAQEGKHDDCIMALAIAHQAREQQSMTAGAAEWRWPKNFPQDLQDDYWNAPAEVRPRLLKKWGLVK